MQTPTLVSPARAYWICLLLLCASTINYMDRQTLANTSQRITTEFSLSEEQYGQLETAFGLAFAAGAVCCGFLADRSNLKWFYPGVVLAWSFMGFATGFAETFFQLLLCRLLLGLFEAGHWPCALKTTKQLLPPESRTLGNSLLQSGTALGAIITPLIMKAMLTPAVGSWRPAFQIIGGVGILWAIAWLCSVRASDLTSTATSPQPEEAAESSEPFSAVFANRRFWILVLVVISINICWHLFRAWLNKFLQIGRGYSESDTLTIVFWFNIATDVGCLLAGFSTKWLNRWGLSVFRSRTWVFTVCCLMSAISLCIPWLPAGWPFLIALLVIGMGSLGQFPCYYAFSQEISQAHQGKVTGQLGCLAWLSTAPLHPLFGRWVDHTKSYDLPLAVAGLLPLLGCVAIWLAWQNGEEKPASL